MDRNNVDLVDWNILKHFFILNIGIATNCTILQKASFLLLTSQSMSSISFLQDDL